MDCRNTPNEIKVCELYQMVRGRVLKSRGELAYLQLDSKIARRRLSVSVEGFGHHSSRSVKRTRFHKIGGSLRKSVFQSGHPFSQSPVFNPNRIMEILSLSFGEEVRQALSYADVTLRA